MKKLLALVLALVPFTCPAPYQLSWNMQPAEGITINMYRVYYSTNTAKDVEVGNPINWIFAGASDVSLSSYTLFVASPPVHIAGVTQLTTNSESPKLVIVLVPPPTNGLAKFVQQ